MRTGSCVSINRKIAIFEILKRTHGRFRAPKGVLAPPEGGEDDEAVEGVGGQCGWRRRVRTGCGQSCASKNCKISNFAISRSTYWQNRAPIGVIAAPDDGKDDGWGGGGRTELLGV